MDIVLRPAARLSVIELDYRWCSAHCSREHWGRPNFMTGAQEKVRVQFRNGAWIQHDPHCAWGATEIPPNEIDS